MKTSLPHSNTIERNFEGFPGVEMWKTLTLELKRSVKLSYELGDVQIH